VTKLFSHNTQSGGAEMYLKKNNYADYLKRNLLLFLQAIFFSFVLSLLKKMPFVNYFTLLVIFVTKAQISYHSSVRSHYLFTAPLKSRCYIQMSNIAFSHFKKEFKCQEKRKGLFKTLRRR